MASFCLESYQFPSEQGCENSWFQEHLKNLQNARDLLWPILEPLGTVKTFGAFYFLVPVPTNVRAHELFFYLYSSKCYLSLGDRGGGGGYSSEGIWNIVDARDTLWCKRAFEIIVRKYSPRKYRQRY